MANFIIILILELVAVAALVIFDGVLNSKYYEKKTVKGLSTETYWALGLMMATGFVWASHRYDGAPSWTLGYMLLQAVTQLSFHVWLIYVLVRAYKAFFKLEFEYDFQYYVARFFLFLSITLEGLAVIGLGMGAMYWHLVVE